MQNNPFHFLDCWISFQDHEEIVSENVLVNELKTASIESGSDLLISFDVISFDVNRIVFDSWFGNVADTNLQSGVVFLLVAETLGGV